MKISGIYQIQSKIKPERIYIGSAINIQHRWNDHLSRMRRNKHHSKKLQNHFNKYGKIDLQFSVLLGCEKENLIKTEQYFIDSHKPWFNIRIKAESNFGLKSSEETKRKLRNKVPWNKGLKGVSEETREKMRSSHLGQVSGHKGHPHSETTKKNMSNLKKGKRASLETKLKMSLKRKGIPLSKETKQRMFIEKKGIYLGKKMSDEFKQKIRDSWVIRKLKTA